MASRQPLMVSPKSRAAARWWTAAGLVCAVVVLLLLATVSPVHGWAGLVLVASLVWCLSQAARRRWWLDGYHQGRLRRDRADGGGGR